MRIVEISKKKTKSGKRNFKAVLYKIQKDSCVVDKTGTEFNLNGITWIEEYCQNNIDSIIGMSVKVEFIDDERVEILGHGETGIVDGIPVYDNATMIGVFEKGYITDMEIDGEECRVCIGEGSLDYMIYKPFIDNLETKLNNGETIHGSIEIMGISENDNKITYLDGWKEEGRIPTVFLHSGWAILAIKPSDNKSKILELNNQKEKENQEMDEIKKMFEDFTAKYVETNTYKENLETKIVEINELTGTVDQLKAALEEVTKERDEWNRKWNELWEQQEVIEKALAEAQAQQKVGEMNSALSNFTDEQKEYAKAEIDAFTADPTSCEINSIVTKIHAEIGKKAIELENERIIAEQNSQKNQSNIDDIFSEINSGEQKEDEDTNIF